MSQSFKILGQITSVANTQSNVYIVPANTATVVNSIMIANQAGANQSYSLIVMPGTNYSSPAANTYYVIRGGVSPANDVITINLGLTLPANTVLAANTNSSSLSFSAFGVEIV